MNDETRKTLNDVAGIPDALQASYEAAVSFEPARQLLPSVAQETLLRMASQEGAVDRLTATDGLTPGLKSLLRQAATPTLSAWLTIRSTFDSALGPFMEKINAVRTAEEKKAAINQRALEAEQAIIREAEAHKPYADAKHAKENADLHFERLHQGEGGRPVKTFGDNWWYYVILLAITSVEWLINFDSLNAWLGVPALAAGGTIALAIGVAFASHCHGTYLKQWTSRFAPHSEGKGRCIGILIAATAALLLVLAVAGWARYSLAAHSISAQGPVIASGEVPSQPNPTTDVVISLGFNLIIWLIGLALAFFSHDENHELMEAHLEQWRRTRKFNRLHKPWEKRITLAKAKATRELEQLRAATELAHNSTKAQRDMLEQVERREELLYRYVANQIQSVVDLYRIALGKELTQHGYAIVVGGASRSGQEYMQSAVTVDARVMRALLS